MCGLFGCNSVFSCIYGECSKQKDGVPCGNVKENDGNGIFGKMFLCVRGVLCFVIVKRGILTLSSEQQYAM